MPYRRFRDDAYRPAVEHIAPAEVYLLTLKTASFKAVIQAHREFRELRRKDDPQLLSWLEEYGDKACLKGLYGGWCVLSSLIWRDKVFSHIRT